MEIYNHGVCLGLRSLATSEGTPITPQSRQDRVMPGVEGKLRMRFKANSFRGMEPCKCCEPKGGYAQNNFLVRSDRLDAVCELITR